MAQRVVDKKVKFGTTSKGKQCVLHKQYDFVKHWEYVNGNIQWRCKSYQKFKCQARLTTKNDEIMGDCDPQHNHDGNKEENFCTTGCCFAANCAQEIHCSETARTKCSRPIFDERNFNLFA